MSFLLMVFLSLVCLVDFSICPPLLWKGSPTAGALSGGLTGLAIGLIGLHAFFLSRRVARPLALDPSQRDRLLPRYERGRFRHQLALLATYVLVLTLFGWGWAVRQFWGDARRPGLELLTLAPFLLAQVLSWLFFYDADRAAHQAAQRLHEVPASQPSFGGRWAYVAFQLRQKLALVFIPVGLMIVHKEVYRQLPVAWQQWTLGANVGGMVGLLTIFVGMPLIVRLVLGLKPLPEGPLRQRLLAAARRLNFRCSDILLWNTRNGMANAMVVGLLPWLRYVVFTDRLLEEFPEEEVEAVFGHEVGHIKHLHMPYYLGFLAVSVAVLSIASEEYLGAFIKDAGDGLAVLLPVLTPVLDWLRQLPADVAVFPVVGVLVAYILVVFGFVSRRCERQADIYGCRAVSCTCATCAGHATDQELPAQGRGLCPTGIRTFIQALEKVAMVNGISRDRPGFLMSWQHSTIALRVAFLERMLGDPNVEPTFQRRVALVKWGLLLGMSAALVVLVKIHGLQLQ
jgi:STE24 endopeptidase